MRFSKFLAPILVFSLAAPVLAKKPAVKPAVHPSRQKLEACKVPGQDGTVDAFCGLYKVWENRAAKSGRKIGLKVVVLPALSPTPKPDPVFFLAGGPGQAVSPMAGFLGEDPLRQDRDIVFIDQRGTGDPDRLVCTLGGHDDDLQSYFGEMFPLDAVAKCRDELSKKADLTQYTTAASVDDFDEIRAWLGYGKINLSGGSYGTRAAQVYLRRHPETVRTVVLSGVVPMDETLPISHAAGGQRSMDLLLGWCEQDAACNGKFPGVRQELQAVLERLDKEPATVEVKHPHTGKPATVRLSRDTIADGLRWALYNTQGSAMLPLMIHQAAAGDFALLAQASVNARLSAIDGITQGLFFSVTCAEDLPFIDASTIPSRTAGSFLGDYRVRQQLAACGIWPHAKLDRAHQEAVRSDVPMLLINGERDPVTPPDFALRTAVHLTKATRIVVPWGSHGGDSPCLETIQREFIEKAGEGVDTSCVSKIERTPFVLEAPKEEKPAG
ncbi:MAG: alpha/beta fold hydrolase [Thermoanaerobaculia bacterium]